VSQGFTDRLRSEAPAIDLPEERWRKIETAVGIEKPDLPFRRRLFSYVKLALPDFAPIGDRDGPKLASVRANLRKLCRDAKRLLDTVRELEEQPAPGALALLFYRGARFDALPETVAAIEATLQSLDAPAGGRPKDSAFDELVATLAAFWVDETGKPASVSWSPQSKRYSGPFLKFLQACVDALAPRHATKSQTAFGKAAQRVLKQIPANLRSPVGGLRRTKPSGF
jgi:hypothetical protein